MLKTMIDVDVMTGRVSKTCRARRGAPALVVAAAASALLAPGCGSSGPTKAQYTASANAICRTAGAQVTPVVRKLTGSAAALNSGNQAAAQEATGALQELHTVTSAALTKLQALPQPSAGHAPVERFLSALASVSAALGRAATTAAASPSQFQQALAQMETAAPAGQRMVAAAWAYGMTQCATLFTGLGAASAAPAAPSTSTAPSASTAPSGQPVHVTLRGANHEPTVNVAWRYTVTASDARGRPLSGTETTHYTFHGAVVGTEKPENVRFTGALHETVEFPPASVGYPLSVQAVVHTSQGTATAEWPVKVRR
jgi:hypothetical protein